MPHARPVSKTYYYVDYKEFCDVVRWRIDEIYRSLDKKLRTVSLFSFVFYVKALRAHEMIFVGI